MSRSLEIFAEYRHSLGISGLLDEYKVESLTNEIVAEVSDESTPSDLIEKIAQESFRIFSYQELWLGRIISAAMSNVNMDDKFWFKYVGLIGNASDRPLHVDAPLATALTHPLMVLFLETHGESDNDMYFRNRILVSYQTRFAHGIFSRTPLMMAIDEWRKGTIWNAKLGRKFGSMKRSSIDPKEFSQKFLEHAMKLSGSTMVVQIGTLLSFDEVFDRVYEKFWKETRALQNNDLIQMPESPPRSKAVDQLRKVFRGDV